MCYGEVVSRPIIYVHSQKDTNACVSACHQILAILSHVRLRAIAYATRF